MTLAVGDLACLSAAEREALWRLYRAVAANGGRQVVFENNGRRSDHPLDVVRASIMADGHRPEQACRDLDLAAEIITACYPAQDRMIYADAFIERLRAGGLKPGRCEDLRKNLGQRLRAKRAEASTPVASGADGGPNAVTLAGAFLDQFYRAESDPEDDDVPGLDLDPVNSPPTSCRAAFRLRYYAGAFYQRGRNVWVATGEEAVRLQLTCYLQGLAPEQATARRVADVLLNVKAMCGLDVDRSPPLPFHLAGAGRMMLALDNGLLDLTALGRDTEPKLAPHDPAWFSTNVLPYRFDPKAKMPRFRAFLAQIFNADPKTLQPRVRGDNRVYLVQEMFGYAFVPDNRFQKFFIFKGDGRNGKGTLLYVLKHLIGPENIASVPLEAMGREFGQEPLVGKMLNICGDMNEIDNAQEGTLKAWTGEDPVTVYRKYRPALEVDPTLKFFFSTNALPWFKDKTDGIWRRMTVIPFTFAVRSDGEADPGLRAALLAERSGILNWALRGLRRLLKQGRFTHCQLCEKAARDHEDDSKPVRGFILNHFSFAHDYAGPILRPRWTATATDIQRLVKAYADRTGDLSIKAHIVCRELVKMPGVFRRRPTTVAARTEFGQFYFGTCIGEPRQLLPEDVTSANESGITDAAELVENAVAVGRASAAAKAEELGKAAGSKHTAKPRGGRS